MKTGSPWAFHSGSFVSWGCCLAFHTNGGIQYSRSKNTPVINMEPANHPFCKGKIIFHTSIIVFHVNFQRCIKEEEAGLKGQESTCSQPTHMVSTLEICCLSEVTPYLKRTNIFNKQNEAVTDRVSYDIKCYDMKTIVTWPET